MAIQIPNPGTGNGATGDNEFVLWSKVKDNFSDQTNAASRLLGAGAGRIPLAEDTLAALTSTTIPSSEYGSDVNNIKSAGNYSVDISTANRPASGNYYQIMCLKSEVGLWQIARSTIGGGDVWMRNIDVRNVPVGGWGKFYTSANTTRDSNGFIKAASPIVKVFADKVKLNDDAVNQNVTYKKNGVGDYTITTVSGLSTDGWYIELPKDMNGNPKVAVTLSEVDGVISLKSYKRIFSMETFTFEPDLDNPLDIPDTRWIDLRLNEIPVEIEDDNQLEEVDLDK